jgi:DNA-directed RNA polymerase subunit M/transcription elongation factor TFIIS
MPMTFSHARSHVVSRFHDALNEVDETLARDLERGLLAYTKQTLIARKVRRERWYWDDIVVRRVYLRRYRMMMHNLHALHALIRNNDVAPCEAAFVDHQRLRPDLYEPILHTLERREKLTQLVDTNEEETSRQEGLLQCQACRSYRTTYVTLQTRSADEPETIFVRCFQCGKTDSIRG